MYTRSYGNENVEIIIPEKYGGTSFIQGAQEVEKSENIESVKNPWENPEIHTPPNEENEESVPTSASPLKNLFGGFLSGFFKNGNISLQRIGKEELLIIATAAFLFFSKEGDKECAIMLLLLLFLG